MFREKEKGSASVLHQKLTHFQRTIAMEFDRKFGVIVQGILFPGKRRQDAKLTISRDKLTRLACIRVNRFLFLLKDVTELFS